MLTGAALAVFVGVAGAQSNDDRANVTPDSRHAPASLMQPANPSDLTLTPNESAPSSPELQPTSPSDTSISTDQGAAKSMSPARPSESPTPDMNAPLKTQAQTSDAMVAPGQSAPSTMLAQASRPSDKTPNMGATENTAAKTEAVPQPTDKMSGNENTSADTGMKMEHGSKVSEGKSAKPMHHAMHHAGSGSMHHASSGSMHRAMKSGSHEQSAMKGDKAYQDALRNCAKQQKQSTRDRCLDQAIEQFHRNT
jgi:hypothetical protein